jgi:hypothetical protein
MVSNLFDVLPVVTFVVVNNEYKPVRTFNSTEGDLHHYLPFKDGEPVVGPRLFRERTLSEIKAIFGLPTDSAAKKFKTDHYTDCLTLPFLTLYGKARKAKALPPTPAKKRQETAPGKGGNKKKVA